MELKDIVAVNDLFAPIYPYVARQVAREYGRTDGVGLEIGPFAGGISIELARHCPQLGLTVGDDFPGLLPHFRQKLEESSLGARVLVREMDKCDLPVRDGAFEGAFAFNLLHLFLAEGRARCAAELCRILRPGGWLCATLFATEDASCGKGRAVEPNTFDDRGGRPAHYFTTPEVKDLFAAAGFIPRSVETIHEQENHGAGPHMHVWHLVTAQRRP